MNTKIQKIVFILILLYLSAETDGEIISIRFDENQTNSSLSPVPVSF
jgi:hypothetical protein